MGSVEPLTYLCGEDMCHPPSHLFGRGQSPRRERRGRRDDQVCRPHRRVFPVISRRGVAPPGPGERSRVRYAVPLSDLDGTLSPHFGEAPYFALLDSSVKEGRLQRKEILSNPAHEMDKQKGLRAAEALLAHKPEIVYAKQALTGKSPEYVFESARVEMRTTKVEALRDLIGVIEEELEKEGNELKNTKKHLQKI